MPPRLHTCVHVCKAYVSPPQAVKTRYSFRTYETERGVVANDREIAEELQGREVAEGLMEPDRVVDLFPSDELLVEFVDCPRTVGHLIKLLGVGPLGPLDRAVELRALGREDEEADPGLLTGLLEGGVKLGAAIHLNRANRKGHAALHRLEEPSGPLRGGPALGLGDVSPGHHVTGRELLERHRDPG